jgi:thiamine pyrophosphokinase
MLAGDDMPGELVLAWANSADLIIAADAGADRLHEAGSAPHMIVGDFDSIVDHERFPGATLHHGPDQNSTDCDKLLALAADLGHSQITLGGVEGDRMDHALATWLSVARAEIDVRLALRQGLGWIVKVGRERTIQTIPGSIVSMLPLSPCEGVVITGVEWPLEGHKIAWDGLVSISNRSVEAEVRASVEHGVAALIVEYPRDAMPLW